MLSSANARFSHFIGEFCVALSCADIPRIKYTMGRVVLVAGELGIVRFAVRVLEKAVSRGFFFCLEHGRRLMCVACSGSPGQAIATCVQGDVDTIFIHLYTGLASAQELCDLN